MNISSLKYDMNEHIRIQITDFKQSIKNYQKNLNNEGVWLFLAALGCWGIPNHKMQSVAFVISIFLFFYRVYLQADEVSSFGQTYKYLKTQIDDSNLDADIKKARLYDLERIKNKELSLLKILKSNSVFIMCFFFTVISMEIAKAG